MTRLTMLKNCVSTARCKLGQASFLFATKRFKSNCGQKAPPPVPPSTPPKRVAIVLSGCGHLDGSCPHEASAVAVHLSKNGVEPVFYAPYCPQADVINHKKCCPTNEQRCALSESARIARSNIDCLAELRYCDVSAVVFPGGFGAAKTLSTFDTDRANCAINGDVMRVMEEFHDAKKPMAFICIAAVLPARMFPCVKVTLGMKGNPRKWPYQYAIDCACEMGAEVEFREVDMFSFDKQHMVFSSPAFMYAGTYSEIFDGIGVMIQTFCKYLE